MNKIKRFFVFFLIFIICGCFDQANTPYSLKRKQKAEQTIEEIKKYFEIKKLYELDKTDLDYIDFIIITKENKILVFRQYIFKGAYIIITIKREIPIRFILRAEDPSLQGRDERHIK